MKRNVYGGVRERNSQMARVSLKRHCGGKRGREKKGNKGEGVPPKGGVSDPAKARDFREAPSPVQDGTIRGARGRTNQTKGGILDGYNARKGNDT